MKAAMIALFAAALIATIPAALAQNLSSKTSGQQHKLSKKQPQVVSSHARFSAAHARGARAGYQGSYGYEPGAPKDYNYENARQAGGGGSGM